jgi:type I restriction enzyme M protein
MSLIQDVPKELKEFAEILDKIAYRHSSYNEVFSDFLDFTIACFLTTGDKELANRLQKKYGAEYKLFKELLQAYMSCQYGCIHSDTDWYDTLGIIYEIIASRWKSSAMGQFFTPPSIVDLMVMLEQTHTTGQKQKVLDPCCGSGRMLIASHAKAPGNFQFGADIDPICAKMSAINMLVHGCVGEISCMDSIAYEWRFGYKINTYLNSIGHPTLIKIEKFEDSYFYVKPNKAQTKVIPRGEFVPAKNEPKILDNGQMSLF